MGFFKDLQKRCISSRRIGLQILGALMAWRPVPFGVFVFGVTPVSILVSMVLSPEEPITCIYLLGLNLIVWLVIKTCLILTEIFSLRRNEDGITWCYVFVLFSILIWLLCFVALFDIIHNETVAIAIGVVGSILALIFQERLKGVLTFIHLKINHLLSIGDWIVVPKFGADGEVERITLTTIIIYNWDTTISNIPLSALQSEHFMNFQHMSDGKTYGRKMSKTFILDTSWFRPLSHDEIQKLRDRINDYTKIHDQYDGKVTDAIHDNLPVTEIEDGMLNVRLFRIYFFHWLMNHAYVSQLPRLVVRWQDQIEGGMPLEVYAFITETGLAAYQHHQSHIVEHFIESLDWFGLRLYQAPSAFDVNNKRVFISQDIPSYNKEITDEI